MEENEILSWWTCPNCWWDKFIIDNRQCLDCWYSLEHNNIDKTYVLEDFDDNLANNFSAKIKEKRFVYSNFWFSSYRLLLNSNNKVFSVKFKEWGKKYICEFLYSLENHHIHEREYAETDIDEREKDFDIKHIKNVKILRLAKKVKSGYSEYRDIKSLYYSPYWIDMFNLKKFITELLKCYFKAF